MLGRGCIVGRTAALKDLPAEPWCELKRCRVQHGGLERIAGQYKLVQLTSLARSLHSGSWIHQLPARSGCALQTHSMADI